MTLILPNLRVRAFLCVRIIGCISLFSLANSASSAALSLTEATTRMLAQHPELHQYAAQSKALATDTELARQSAPFSLGLETSEIDRKSTRLNSSHVTTSYA